MNLQLVRDAFHSQETIGKLFIDGIFECHTIEDTVREVVSQPVSSWKIPAKTAIPRGIYEVAMTMSNRFKKIMPLLINVPGFDGVRIHSGNTSADTEGCIIIGRTRLISSVGESRIAVSSLYQKIQEALDRKEKVFIEIK